MRINLVVALSSEARPLIDHYGLTLRSDTRGFPVYTKDHVQLIVTGVGKVSTAAATAYLASFDSSQDSPWLNVGIAGSSSFTLGSATLAHKITDGATGKSWYPPQAVTLCGTGVHVITYDQPVVDYPAAVVCEMEAAAFYSVATRFNSGELVQCCKIISDNNEADVSDLTPTRVEELVGDQIQCIDNNIQTLSGLNDSSVPNLINQIDLGQYYAYWHFSATQKVQLKEALRKVSIRSAPQMLDAHRWQHCRSARDVLSELDQYLKSLPVTL